MGGDVHAARRRGWVAVPRPAAAHGAGHGVGAGRSQRGKEWRARCLRSRTRARSSESGARGTLTRHCCIEPSRNIGAARSSPELRQTDSRSTPWGARWVAKWVDVSSTRPPGRKILGRAIMCTLNATVPVFALLLVTFVALAGGTGWDLGGLGVRTLLGAAASGVLYYGLGFLMFLTGLRLVTASYAGAFLPLIPVFGVAAGYLVGERLDPRQWVGALVIVAATAAIVWRQRS